MHLMFVLDMLFPSNSLIILIYIQWLRFFAASVLKEKLSVLGSSGVLADHQLQAQLQEHHMKG